MSLTAQDHSDQDSGSRVNTSNALALPTCFRSVKY